jgi:hypothetical protein
MRVGHAAVVVLVGWYLMLPQTKWQVLGPSNWPEPVSAPLHRWRTLFAFDTASECEEELTELRRQNEERHASVEEKCPRYPLMCVSNDDKILDFDAAYARCIASGDLRPKNNQAKPS